MGRAAAANRASKGSGNAAQPQGNEATNGCSNSRRRRRSRDLEDDDADAPTASEANDDCDTEEATEEESPQKAGRGEDPHEMSECRLAEALAAFLRDNHPRGLALGALAGSEVRQSLRDPMRDAGVRSFKAKFLSRFPAELLFDGKMVRPAPSFQPAPRGGGDGKAPNEEIVGDCKAQALRLSPAALASQPVPPMKHPSFGSLPRSCLRRSSEPGLGAQTQGKKQQAAAPRRASFADLIDVLVFKLGHEPGAVSARGQHVRRPMNQGDSDEAPDVEDEEDEDESEEDACGNAAEKVGDNRQDTSKTDRNSMKYAKAKDHWLDPSMLPPATDLDEDDQDEDASEFEQNADETHCDLDENIILEPPLMKEVLENADAIDDDEDSDWVKV
mmetsp:Transcript_41583/g.89273  ORF Transcript_41583/g.89273 Transcript_41583/m.89273 type:complete len:387 (+) Transcript_41583:315-1475(+)|eukprot:CAMPEP_0194768246 /NCGR_PEP_ID=MMETSP0323_2-20130528/38987_1 /TAXON_ID=2866 ORGANISM="Crypthecodinium cohnii, Strain Seligo" /NCGR_SAMPLE_ID=MMETSP0323_2 /ASSEMBLY_ACC=CAM_ASM_000346 /LENGTH=386 /DNA_ID=CAMNT_0039700543 /DNA_START=31 /DNA_END=1191 /DNA_ORIENTATION=-